MDKNMVRDFIKKHKLQLGLAAGTVAGITIWVFTKDKASNYIDVVRPELNTGEWTQLYRGIKGKYSGSVTGFAKAVDLTDLGKFGDALATIDGIDPHEPIRIMFGTEKSFK